MQANYEPTTKDYLWLHLRDLPYFRAVLRAVEARFYKTIELTSPTLDLGCGDGHFASIAFDKPLDFGLDPWTGPLRKALKQKSYRCVIQGVGDTLPFEDAYFSNAVSNSVLEHIPDLDPVLNEISRVLKPDGLFIFCVPNHLFLENLSVSRFFDKVHLYPIARAYRTFFNRISRHFHCDNPETWLERLTRAGFKLERYWHYFSPKALTILEWGHYLGLPSLIIHAMFRKWILVPTRANLWLTRRIVESVYNEPDEQVEGSYSFFIARKI